MPTESTVRKFTRRLGPDLVAELIRGVIELATRERRFAPRAMRTDSTVVEADVRHPTDGGLAATGVRLLAAGARRLAGAVDGVVPHVRDRSRAVGRRLRAMTRTLRRRTGEARDEVLRPTAEAGVLLGRSVREARRALAAVPEHTSTAARRTMERLEILIGQATTVIGQIAERVRAEPIADRLVSFADPDARPVRKGKIATPTQFGYVSQLAERTSSTRRGSRGLILPQVTRPGSVHENQLLPMAWHAELPHRELAFLPVGTDDFRGYWAAMEFALRFAEVNRSRMLDAAEAAFGRHTAVGRMERVVDVHHNYAAWEHHVGVNGIVHRKGAVRARAGETVLIPGSMGTASYVGEGLGNAAAFETCQHGAGRAMSRTAARKAKTSKDVYAEMAELGVALHSGDPKTVAEEAAFAYKDIDAVMAASASLVKPVKRLTPLGVVKG